MRLELDSELCRFIYWLTDEALPLWTERGVDAQGGCAERLRADGSADFSSDRRVLAQARQSMVFAAAHRLGWTSVGRELNGGIESYLSRFARIDADLHYGHIIDANDKLIDSRQDLYDCAFHLLRIGWRYLSFNDKNALDQAYRLQIALDQRFRSPSGGWLEGDHAANLRRQNPHMHLFEAYLTLYRASGDDFWLKYADEVLDLLLKVFFDPSDIVIREYFDKNWQRTAAPQGDVVEPGHMMEWVWLLRVYQQMTGEDMDALCNRLYERALELGQDPASGLLFDAVDSQGKVLSAGKRSWPMVEWIKASLAQASFSRRHRDYVSESLSALKRLRARYIRSDSPGLYLDQIGPDNAVSNDSAPSSTLYHFTTLALEARRFLDSSAIAIPEPVAADEKQPLGGNTNFNQSSGGR